VDEDVTILYLVPEGTTISTEDVNNGMILAKLDKAPLEEKLVPSQKQLLQAQDLYTEAKEQYGITLGQNESDISAGRLQVEFARMDMQRYLGRAMADNIVQNLFEDPNATLDAQDLLQDPNTLGGASRHIYNQWRDSIMLAQATLIRAQDKSVSTRKLYEAEYVSLMELEGDKLEVESSKVKHQQALMELELFLTYDFPKEAKRLFSSYKEKLRELDRTRAKARAFEAQARSKLSARDAGLKMAKDRVAKYKNQIAACNIKATTPGLVIHASGRDIFERVIASEEIREGANVRFGQKIITLPDTSEMLVQLGISETSIHRVRNEQKATITMDAFPDQTYQGIVSHVAQLPNPQGPFSADIKVYLSRVDIINPDEGLKPSMSAKVEILVEHLENVLVVPIQCIISQADKKICFVKTQGQIEEREITTGSFGEAFVHITSGLVDGERILLNPLRYVNTSRSSRLDDRRPRTDK
jgi:multidrug efflux pump subunit AcrA (membrane-fusion protein)